MLESGVGLVYLTRIGQIIITIISRTLSSPTKKSFPTDMAFEFCYSASNFFCGMVSDINVQIGTQFSSFNKVAKKAYKVSRVYLTIFMKIYQFLAK